MGSIDVDSGAMIRDGIKSVHKLGVCHEKTWVYDITKFTQKPSSECYEEALKSTCKEYARVPQTLEDMKGCINEGFPYVFGFLVLSSFMTQEVADTGIMPMPKDGDAILGGHAVQCCGYDDDREAFIVRNSWGEGWGASGYFFMPYAYMVHPGLVQDIWAIRFVDGSELPCRRM